MKHKTRDAVLTAFVLSWMTLPAFAAESPLGGGIIENSVTTKDVVVEANQAKEEAKYESQQTTIITAEDIAKKQAKSVEEIIFNETGVTRTIDAMGRVGVSIRGAEPRHTLILIDGQPVMGDVSKYSGQGDELQRLGTENVERIEIIKGAASAKYGADAIGGVVNVVTKRAQKDAGLQVNLEGRRAKGDGDVFPYQNFFLRADSGQMGNVRLAVYGSKRDIMPVYEKDGLRDTVSGSGLMSNSLRYYGDIKNVGIIGTYDINERNKIDINFDRTTEDLERYVKHTVSEMEPQQHFKRDLTRDKKSITYTGNNGGSTDWKISYDYSKLTEDNVTLSSYLGNSVYVGANTLEYVDDLKHTQRNFKASANTQINDRHLLTYGFGYSKEEGEGSRINHNTYTKAINPWDYDKNLANERVMDRYGNWTETDKASSNVRIYNMAFVNGVPQYDQNYEFYGQSETPEFTYADYNRLTDNGNNPRGIYSASGKDLENINAFGAKLEGYDTLPTVKVMAYYNPDTYGSSFFAMKLNGKLFQEIYKSDDLVNHVNVGRATIRKHDFFLQDTWQLNDNTILSPIVRFDHSNLFGSEVTFNLGLTHNIRGKANQRFKANIGTGYTEPGIGELYYSWEMYSGSPTGDGVGRLGYYWIGNPDLKPEKSVNFDMGIETEHGKTSTRFNVFHNKIDDYMTTYFTGNLLDFHPDAQNYEKFLAPPDMIYSFKNIGRAEITGVEAELNHRFNEHWTGRLGYTYLHAVNKSDPDMPDRLLDKPQHKVDIGVTWENKSWRASLWGNYYINMLDSNSIVGSGNYMESGSDSVNYYFENLQDKKNMYQKKTFGLWNLLVQKELSKDSSVYVGIDNIFNHRDDDRAFQERVYKMGLNLKFGADKDTPLKAAAKKVTADAAKAVGVADTGNSWFIQAPFDTTKEEGVQVIGDYRARWNSYTGENKPETKVTKTTSVGSAEKNIREKGAHGFEQRLRLGVDARIGENTNVTVLGSASGMSGVDTMHDVSDSKGLNHQRVENIDVTQHANKWDFSVGRLTEPMGVTGYWFGKEYDGGRAVWTDTHTQVRFGYGDFSHSTGITDSAYTHATRQSFYRSPTKAEWLGALGSEAYTVPGYEGMLQKLEKAETAEEELAIMQSYLDVIKDKDPEGYQNLLDINAGRDDGSGRSFVSVRQDSPKIYEIKYMEKDENGDWVTTKTYYAAHAADVTFRIDDVYDVANLEQEAKNLWDSWSDTGSYDGDAYRMEWSLAGYGTYHGDAQVADVPGNQAAFVLSNRFSKVYAAEDLTAEDFTVLKKEEAEASFIQSVWNKNIYATNYYYGTTGTISSLAKFIVNYLAKTDGSGWKPEDGTTNPLTFLTDKAILVESGTVLVRDQIPSIDRAFFIQAKHELSPRLGVQAWYLRSVNDDTHVFAAAHGNGNDYASFDRLANVIGIGAKYRFGDNVFLSFDWGQNRTDFGRYMNGHTLYNDSAAVGSESYFEGRANGGTPRFWTVRFDIGKADMDVPGSWNAFADYKYFQHGSFFGGNGTEALPDRYLDGIKSFTIGGGYVPAKDFLIEAFYTFDAKGIGKRDTLYGSENFTLGDYTRIQATFRF